MKTMERNAILVQWQAQPPPQQPPPPPEEEVDVLAEEPFEEPFAVAKTDS